MYVHNEEREKINFFFDYGKKIKRYKTKNNHNNNFIMKIKKITILFGL